MSYVLAEKIEEQASPALESWVQGFAELFDRVAFLHIDQADAIVAAVAGIEGSVGRSLSLIENTPFRWAIEAGSPYLGAGTAPGGDAITDFLQISLPRAYAIVPIVLQGHLVGLVYGDRKGEGLPLGAVAQILAYCSSITESATETTATETTTAEIATESEAPELALIELPTTESESSLAESSQPLVPAPSAIETPAPVSSEFISHQLPKDSPTRPALELEEESSEACQFIVSEPALIEPPLKEIDALIFEEMDSLETSNEEGAEPLYEDDFVITPLTHWVIEAANDEAGQIRVPIDLLPDHMGSALSEELISEPPVQPTEDVDVPVLPEMPTVEELVELPEIAFADELVLLSDDATLVEASPVESDSLAPAVPASFLASPYSEEHVEESLPIISEPVSEPAVSTAQEEINYDEWVLTSQGLVQRSERSFPWIRLLASSFVAMAALFLMVLWPMSPKTMSSEEIHLLHIKPGATIHQIAGRLEESSLIRNTRAFSLLARVFGVDRSLKAGVYRISSGAWLWDVVGELHKGQVETLAVTLPEGLNVKEVAERLEQSGLIEADAIIKAASDPKLLSRFGISASSVEGFLFPETYTFAKGLKADEILEVMLDEFFARLNQIQGDHPARGDALRNMVTLASIVQREAKADIEMPKVAGVFQNRIQNHLRLESCATVQYILGENKLRLTLQDVRTESPYNTYLKEGLPPGPIANPGMAALKAAANPGSHEYLFFFAKSDGSGRHIFSHNYKEHQRLQKRFRHN